MPDSKATPSINPGLIVRETKAQAITHRLFSHRALVNHEVHDQAMIAAVDRAHARGQTVDVWLGPWLQAQRVPPFLYALKRSTNVEQANAQGATLLMQAVMLGTKEGGAMVEGLLAVGADAKAVNHGLGDTVLHIAAYSGVRTYPTIPMLIAAGANPWTLNRQGQTPLLCWVQNTYADLPDESLAVLPHLTDNAPDRVWCESDGNGNTPLMLSLNRGDRVMRALILAGAGISLHIGGERSPWNLAASVIGLQEQLTRYMGEAAALESATLRRQSPANTVATNLARRHRL